MKKILALVLAAVMALSLVVAVAEDAEVNALSAWVLAGFMDAEGNLKPVEEGSEPVYLIFYDNGCAYATQGENEAVYAVEILDAEAMVFNMIGEDEVMTSGLQDDVLVVTQLDAENNPTMVMVFQEYAE